MRSWLCLIVLVLMTTVQSSVPYDALRPNRDDERRSYLSVPEQQPCVVSLGQHDVKPVRNERNELTPYDCLAATRQENKVFLRYPLVPSTGAALPLVLSLQQYHVRLQL